MTADPVLLAAAAWLLTYTVHSTVLLGIAWAITARCPRLHPRTAEVLWRVALLGAVATATLQCAGLVPLGQRMIVRIVAMGDVPPPALDVPLAPPGLRRWWTSFVEAGLAAAALAYGAAAVTRLVGVGRARRRLRTALAGRTPAPALEARARGLAGDVAVRVSVARTIATPLLVGRREICLPARALAELSAQELDAVLAHEIAHVRRGDGRWLWAIVCVERALFIQPLNRVAGARLRAIAERCCDEWAVRRTAAPTALASALARVAEWMVSEPWMAAVVGMATRDSPVLARVRRILDPATLSEEAPPRPLALAAAMLPTVLVGLAAPTFSPTPAAAPARPYTVQATDDGGPFTITLDGGRVVGLTVDGVPVDRTRLRQIADRVLVDDPTGRPMLDLRIRPEGGISWSSRPPRSVGTP